LRNIFLKTATPDSPFTSRIPAGKILRVPIAHGEGCYFADEETLAKAQGQQPNPVAILRRRRKRDRHGESQRRAAKHRRHLQ
jgi:phosphoribosylformylglycinamidine (FGAM) synthase-like amidotransferase family enzyme